MIDWGFAVQVAGVGFIAVFTVLGILSLILWLVSLSIIRVGSRSSMIKNNKDNFILWLVIRVGSRSSAVKNNKDNFER
jgi:Na+-transporting methylmalonyl-CoA/oxaloacetate decarboxylase gamma subunit